MIRINLIDIAQFDTGVLLHSHVEPTNALYAWT